MAHRTNWTARIGTLVIGPLLLAMAARTTAQDVAAPPSMAASAASAASPASATAAATPASGAAATLAPVLVTGRFPALAGVAGWGDLPLSQTPVQATVIEAAQLRNAGAERLADIIRFDAAISDAYNSEGYIDYFTVRGFVIDNRFNFRRDELPINAETSIPIENKSRVDVLEGISGIEAGTSSPGGLIDVIVKRPLEAPLTSAFVQWRQAGNALGSVDISRRFGVDQQFGLRLNAAAEHLDSYVYDDQGNRNLLALAGDWRIGTSTLIEAEVEQSHRSQPSVPGFSLLGDSLPAVGNPRINLNNQPWSLPTVFDATTASLRITQRLNDDWRVIVHGLTQRLRTDDRTAFPFGCTATDGTYYPDRYCPDGTFDLYDFRSEDEQRHEDALDLSLRGHFVTGPVGHTLAVGALRTLVHNTFNAETYNYAGTGNVGGTAIVPPAPDATSTNTDRNEYSTELYLRDAIALDTRTTLWLGARHTRLDRRSVATDGTSPTQYSQSFTTPFAAATYMFLPGQIAYVSWGQSVQSDVAPNLPRYSNAGQAAPAAKSRQSELGLKGTDVGLAWSVAAFDITQPLFGDLGACVAGPDDPPDCLHTLVGEQHHTGIDASGSWHRGPWELRGGVQWLHARLEGQADPSLDGKRPTNVPALSARLLGSYSVAPVPGLAILGGVSYESSREVLPDNSIAIPSVTRFDLGARYEQRVSGVNWTLRAGVDNVFDRSAWRESPYQYSHVYLFPLAPRTFRVSLQADL